MPAMSNKTLCLLLWGTQSEDDPVVSGPRHRATKRHMTTLGHIQSISKGTRNYMLQRSLFFPPSVSFLEWFISPALLSSTWQNTAHIHHCRVTTSTARLPWQRETLPVVIPLSLFISRYCEAYVFTRTIRCSSNRWSLACFSTVIWNK